MTTQRRHGRGETAAKPIVYPEGDGKPMAESDIHRDEMVRLIYTLQDAFADRGDVYVSGNMLLYYEEGNPRASVAPDVMVFKGVDKHRRRIYKLWEELVPPSVVIEVTSPTTRREDRAKKWALYARLGVGEYYLYDPLNEYLRPPLQGYRLDEGEFRAIAPDAHGGLLSAELDLQIVLVNGQLRLRDRQAGADLLSPAERAIVEAERARAAAERAEAAAARAETEAAARRAAEQRIAELEALLRRQERGRG
jgi:Uma2 family endonuclease